MPFGPFERPSIGLSLLKAALTCRGIGARVEYFNLEFARRVGPAFYANIANGAPAIPDIVGEWVFAGALAPQSREQEEAYLYEVLRGGSAQHPHATPVSESLIDAIRSARRLADAFVDECLELVLAAKPRIVGFTSVFQQQVASLALAKRLKAAAPAVTIVFGGANCEGVMGRELIRQFPFVDVVVPGEADTLFPDLVSRVLAGRADELPAGVLTQSRDGRAGHEDEAPARRAAAPVEMNALPVPDYDEFFERFHAAQFGPDHRATILFETSRGCWWGEKQHCTFCGLNGASMRFRSKSGDRALAELKQLTQRYPGHNVFVVDNILDMQYFKDFVPALASEGLGLNLFYEVKANLRKEQLRLLRAAGITEIQPGIESLSTPVLRLMRKGVTGLQNVQLLKWAKELGLTPYWNMLVGFPGESPDDYAAMTRLLPHLAHLRPPYATAVIRMDRFSPNFDLAEAQGFRGVAPYPSYAHVYGLAPAALANIACHFTYSYRDPQDVAAYADPLRHAVQSWQAAYPSSDLFYTDDGAGLLVRDFRPVASRTVTALTGAQRDVFLACDGIRTEAQLRAILGGGTGELASADVLRDVVDPLLERGFLLREGLSYLTLAVPVGGDSSYKSRIRVTAGPPTAQPSWWELGAPLPSGDRPCEQ